MNHQRPSSRWRPLAAELLAAAAGPAVLLTGLRGVLPTLKAGLWGPADPWLNVDFNGGWWLWWAGAEQAAGRDPFTRVDWPAGAESIAGVFPNPLELLALGWTLGAPTALAWNLVQLLTLLLNLLASHALMRAAGASRLAAAAGGALLAASPVLLHEVAGGRPVTLVAWPGLLALALLARVLRRPGEAGPDEAGDGARGEALSGRAAITAGLVAGLLAAAQGVAYAWYGVALLLVGATLIGGALIGGALAGGVGRRWRDAASGPALAAAVAAGGLCVTPYLWWLLDGLAGVPMDLPPAGYTALPLAGLWGLEVPERYWLHPLLFGASLLGLRGGGRWLAAGWVGLAIAVGPAVTWALGEPFAAGPWAWVSWAVEAANRNHHPIRATLFACPLLACALALGVDRMRWSRAVAIGVLASSVWGIGALDRVATYAQPPAPPFAEVVIPGEGAVADVLGQRAQTALSLQTVHGRAITEPLWMVRAPEGFHGRLDGLSRGAAPPAGFWDALAASGVSHVLVLDRFGDAAPQVTAIVEQALGPPVTPGVYALE